MSDSHRHRQCHGACSSLKPLSEFAGGSKTCVICIREEARRQFNIDADKYFRRLLSSANLNI